MLKEKKGAALAFLLSRAPPRSFLRYLIIGGGNTLVGLGMFPLLYVLAGDALGFQAVLALSYIVCTFISFTTHRFFTFESAGPPARELQKYAGLSLVNYLLNQAFLALLAPVVPWPLFWLQIALSFLLVLLNFFGLQHFVFTHVQGKEKARQKGS
jgi:putative flippase GtrA